MKAVRLLTIETARSRVQLVATAIPAKDGWIICFDLPDTSQRINDAYIPPGMKGAISLQRIDGRVVMSGLLEEGIASSSELDDVAEYLVRELMQEDGPEHLHIQIVRRVGRVAWSGEESFHG